MAAFWGETPEDVVKGKCSWTDGTRERKWPMRRFVRSCRKRGLWGWCEKKKLIHAWIADYADPGAVIRFFAHELGHMQRPHHRRRGQEEAKAEQYASVAKTAFEMMIEILKKEGEQL